MCACVNGLNNQVASVRAIEGAIGISDFDDINAAGLVADENKVAMAQKLIGVGFVPEDGLICAGVGVLLFGLALERSK